MKLVSFVIPCYRSEHTIAGVVEEINRAMAELPQYDHEIVLVNDCSPDGTFAVLEKTGESRENYINTAILAVQSYAPTLLPAAELNEQVKTAMFGAAQLPGVAAVHLNSDYNFTDTSSKAYRYQAVYNITYYDQEGL